MEEAKEIEVKKYTELFKRVRVLEQEEERLKFLSGKRAIEI